MAAADILLVPGSDDVNYTASKLYPYILLKKPLVVVAHKLSPMVSTLKELNVGELLTFEDSCDNSAKGSHFSDILTGMIGRLPFEPDCDWRKFDKYEAAAMTHRVCQLFDEVIQ